MLRRTRTSRKNQQWVSPLTLWRMGAALTVQDVAELSKVSYSTVSRMVTGQMPLAGRLRSCVSGLDRRLLPLQDEFYERWLAHKRSGVERHNDKR